MKSTDPVRPGIGGNGAYQIDGLSDRSAGVGGGWVAGGSFGGPEVIEGGCAGLADGVVRGVDGWAVGGVDGRVDGVIVGGTALVHPAITTAVMATNVLPSLTTAITA